MKKYADVELLKSTMLENVNIMAEVLGDENADSYVSVNHVIDLIDGLPAADVQEVVRCKDCKYLLKDLSEREAHLCVRTPLANSVTLDSYCSYGERKGGESQ